MYADNFTGSMQRAISEVERRRKLQIAYNKKHKITPQQITKPFRDRLIDVLIEDSGESKHIKDLIGNVDYEQLPPDEIQKEIKKFTELMKYEAEMLNFETATVLRDKVRELKKLIDL